MRILIVCHYFPPLQASGSIRPAKWKKFFELAGHEVTILTTDKGSAPPSPETKGCKIISLPVFPFFSRIKNFYESMNTPNASLSASDKKSTGFTTKIKAIAFYFMKYLKSRGCITGQRWPSYFLFWARKGFQYILKKEKPFDVVISTYGPYHTHILAHKIKKNGFARYWVADYRDLWCLNPYFKGLPLLNHLELSLEKRLMRNADLITTVSNGLKVELQSIIKGKKIEVIENGIDPDDFHTLNNTRFHFPKAAKLQFAFTGSIYPHQESLILKFFKEISNLANQKELSDLDLHVNFAGSIQPSIQQMVEKFNLHQYTSFLGSLSHQESLRLQRDANILIFLGHDLTGQEGNLTGKIGEYLFSKTPIWAFGVLPNSEVFNIICKIDQNKVFGQSASELSAAFLKIVHQPYSDKIYTNPPASITDKFNRKFSSERLLNLIENEME